MDTLLEMEPTACLWLQSLDASPPATMVTNVDKGHISGNPESYKQQPRSKTVQFSEVVFAPRGYKKRDHQRSRRILLRRGAITA
ncbi:hypothetical protein H0G86_001708 [Trichoderma simmonsii]|uniref:Uncharacterized protein n=1 Tax=Trichoderma simmonsii TaxID=1491479 RepID=A0A8G0L240_9HYPO|nr:hypothetical protein H0G86_001708 [Trichoderma simmonsii]